MKLLRPIFLGIIISLSITSCSKDDTPSNSVEITGIVQKQLITTYQYGTHTISGYALRSSSVTLDNYINQNITVIGRKIDGYPVDGGPEFIEVERIK